MNSFKDSTTHTSHGLQYRYHDDSTAGRRPIVKDGTNRGGRRVRAGAKPGPLGEKLAAGRPATRLEFPLNEPFDFAGNDIGDGAVRAGETMPEPSDYLSEIQCDGKPLGADLVYRETW